MSGVIHVVTAAAGAGKTTRIVGDIAGIVAERPPEEILATTFTVTAADELLQRARAELFRQGSGEAAARLLGARFGTVNAVCGQIVAEFALDLGRSPSTGVLADANETLVFSIAADAAIGARAPVLNGHADIFGYGDPRPPGGGEAPDWRRTVRNILTLARANGVAAADLAQSADRSAASFLALFPPAAANGDALDADLTSAVAAAMAARPTAPSSTAMKSLPALRNAHQRLTHGEILSWSAWAGLTKVGCAPTKDGRAYADALAGVVAAAARHAEHPRLRADSEQFIREIFACAAEALEAYQAHKAERGLVDFVDQEVLALEVLRDPALAARLRERVSRVFVDEFQDSSPLQLAVFTTLAEVVEASTWVGDPKQAIFGFRGADTELTQAAFVGAAQAQPDLLSVSWRSRPGIVRFANAAFGPVFERMGLPAAQHAFSGAARTDAGFDREPFAYWPLAGTLGEQAAALAEEVDRTLANGASWQVEDPAGEHRRLRAGDIAVLCRTNKEVARFAAALSQAGLPVAVERSGLARTPHVELALAAYRWIADPTDRLALAELARFFADDPESDAWLIAASAEDPAAALCAASPVTVRLAELRAQVLNLTPAELLDAVLELPEVIARVEQWGDRAIRLDDLEALRGFACAYETECAASGAPATPSGLLLALSDADPKRPPSLAADAIQVMTYHGAKGLEWPMVILTGLAWEPKARLFEPVAEVAGDLDWRHPLANRWIRYWPWPYGLSGSGSPLDLNAAASPHGQAAWRRAVDEDTRLLYVGVTRARDYLVLAPPLKGGHNWLKVLDGGEGAAHVSFPGPDDNLIRAGDESFVADVRHLSNDEEETARPIQPAYASPLPATSATRAPLYLRPSEVQGSSGWEIVERISLGGRLRIDAVSDMAALGDALHAILAYDDPSRPQGTRLADAERILARWRIKGFSAQDALTASDRLQTHLRGRWPEAKLTREVPVTARIGEQLVHGRIDLLVDRSNAYAIVDHKSFPGRFDQWEGRALLYASQMGLYAEAVQKVTARACDELWVHMPIVGAMLRVAKT
jgi:ATP-dependent exoDNAse (exonuclease V) beta subunit